MMSAALMSGPGIESFFTPCTARCGMYSSRRFGEFHTPTTMASRTAPCSISRVMTSSTAQSTLPYDVAGSNRFWPSCMYTTGYRCCGSVP